MVKRSLLAALVLAVSITVKANDDGVELHAHLFMKEGMSWMFDGDFFGPLRARSWTDRFSSQANPEAMERSQLKIVVAALYAHPLFSLSLRDSVRRQIELARRFVRENPSWVLATDPKAAAEDLAAGKRLLVLSLEGASGVLENEDDLKEFIDRGGIRIVTPLHLTDDRFGGVAFLRSWMALANPMALLRQLLGSTHDDDGVMVNDRGLTDEGRWLARELIKRHVWIDLAHASDRSAEELIALCRKAGQPILYTHTILRRFHRAERGITAEQLQAVRETRGIVGIMPAEDMLEGTTGARGMAALQAQAREISFVIGAGGVAMGSDYNGGVRHLPPTLDTRTTLGEKGFWQIGQGKEAWTLMRKTLASPNTSKAETVVKRFLDAWARVFATAR